MGDGCSLLLAPIGLNLNLSKNQDGTHPEIYLGSRESGERRAQGQAWHRRADKDGWLGSTPTIMASEKWGYLLLIPNEGNHRVYIVLFIAWQGVCVCVQQIVYVMLRASSEGQREKKNESPPTPCLSLLLFWMGAQWSVLPARLICIFTELPRMRNLNPLKHVA